MNNDFIGREAETLKLKTNNNFTLTISILKNQCFMPSGKAERKAGEIFREVREANKNGNKNITVDDLLIQEIKKAEAF